jgi:hypothetical protein
MWTVDPTPCQSFGDRELEMSKNIDIKNPEIAMCEIPTESEPSDQDVIWTVDLTPCRVSGIESWRCQRILTSRIPKPRCVKSRLNLNRQIKM